MLQVKQIVNEVFTSNTYILFDDEHDYCWLVDIGDYQKVADALPQGLEIRGVFLTHVHFDHICGLNDLYEQWPSSTVYTNLLGVKAVFDDKINLSRYHEHPFIYKGDNVKVLSDEEEIMIYPEVVLMVYSTPGHNPSCLTFVVDNWIFTGDSFIPGVKVVTKLPGGDRGKSKESLNRIMELAVKKTICPGHGEMTQFKN